MFERLNQEHACHALPAAEMVAYELVRTTAGAVVDRTRVVRSVSAIAALKDPAVDDSILPGAHVLGKTPDSQQRLTQVRGAGWRVVKGP